MTLFPPVDAGAREAGATQRLERTVAVDGLSRRYIVYLPRAARGDNAMPVVLGFHGGYGTAEWFERQSELHLAKGASEFIIAYPNGYVRSWNAGRCCARARREGIDDVAFVRAILRDLGEIARIDRKRVYATGFSNGGMMAYRLGCDLSEEIAAIAPAGGGMQERPSDCRPRRPVPVMHFHGRLDEWIPFAGGLGKHGKVAQPPIADSIGFWTKANRCTEEKTVTVAGGATCEAHTACRDDADVLLCVVDGMGHQWAGHQPRPRFERLLGPPSTRVRASDAVLEFFRAHRLD